ncbi:hypothetical protein T492DRAFT_1016110 [Pavlovales sp. CCMP2436]|nr:hypothetical protein T492DRAFT_1016110 [Pavlovales sp. CCMP2436]
MLTALDPMKADVWHAATMYRPACSRDLGIAFRCIKRGSCISLISLTDRRSKRRIVGCVVVWLPVDHTHSVDCCSGGLSAPSYCKYHESHLPQRLGRLQVC